MTDLLVTVNNYCNGPRRSMLITEADKFTDDEESRHETHTIHIHFNTSS